eukprot:3489273-Rhodomonas_salina.2
MPEPSRPTGAVPALGVERSAQAALAMSYACKSPKNEPPPPARTARARQCTPTQTASRRCESRGCVTGKSGGSGWGRQQRTRVSAEHVNLAVEQDTCMRPAFSGWAARARRREVSPRSRRDVVRVEIVLART